MTAVDRTVEARDNAAAMIGMVWADIGETTAEILAHNVIKGLADAGLLVTDEIQAVLDAATDLHSRHMAGKPTRGAYVRLNHASDAYLASRQP